jgi:ABC-type nickel/cobalt efflux system permease component RcnA
MDNRNTSYSGGVSLAGLTFIVFLVLKLCNVIDWSWWWVTAPLWGPFALGLVIFIVAMAVILIKEWIKQLGYKKHEKKQMNKWR